MLTFVAIVISMAGIAHLATTDPKRRRAFKLPPLERRHWVGLALGATVLPGLVLLVLANWAGLTIWAGTVTTLGWLMVALPPDRYAAWKARIAAAASSLRERLFAPPAALMEETDARIAALESRLATLESRLHTDPDEDDGNAKPSIQRAPSPPQ
ncbi:MAG: hypothetical protein AAGF30_11100 [Pseudomonadota bacterium]